MNNPNIEMTTPTEIFFTLKALCWRLSWRSFVYKALRQHDKRTCRKLNVVQIDILFCFTGYSYLLQVCLWNTTCYVCLLLCNVSFVSNRTLFCCNSCIHLLRGFYVNQVYTYFVVLPTFRFILVAINAYCLA